MKVANGETLCSEGKCTDTNFRVQGMNFSTDFFIFSLGVCDCGVGSPMVKIIGNHSLGFCADDNEVSL